MEVQAPTATQPSRVEAVVLKLNQGSARIRVVGEPGEMTFRSRDLGASQVFAPGQLATLLIEKRWPWRGDSYASGRIESARIDIPPLGLVPLSLQGGGTYNFRDPDGPHRGRDAYSKLWRKHTAKPRPSYEFDELAWGTFPEDDPDDNPTCVAAELRAMGRVADAYTLLMRTLGRDLRVLDAHAGLGNIAFDDRPDVAIVHYDIGVRIGLLSLPADYDGLLPWSHLSNRPFLRCMHGYALCLWRRQDFSAATAAFERILSLNPNDNQGARFCWEDARRGRSWEESQEDSPK